MIKTNHRSNPNNLSFLEKELKRETALLRINAYHTVKSNKNGKKPPETREECIEILQGIEPNTHAIKIIKEKAKTWILTGETQKNLTEKDWQDPNVQTIMGTILLLNACLPKEIAQETKTIQTEPRLDYEKTHYALMSQGMVGNSNTRIGFGEPETWFWFHPIENKINMDIGYGLLFGLQNARAILLHEIGHSQITTGRTPKQISLREKIQEAFKEIKKGNRLSKKEAIELACDIQEEKARESFFQVAEDCAVNIFAEVEGKKTNQNVKTSILRNYCMLGTKKEICEAEKAMKILGEIMPSLPNEPNPSENFRHLINAASMGYPLTRNILNSDTPWSILGTDKNPKTEEIVARLIGSPESTSYLQPSFHTNLLEKLDKGILVEKTRKLGDKRNQSFDEIFDDLLLPEIEKLKEEFTKKMEEGMDQNPMNGEGKPGDIEIPYQGENEGEDEGKSKEPGKDDPDVYKKASDVITETEEKERKEKEKRDRQTAQSQKEAEDNKRETIKNSSGYGSPFDNLPKDCESYEDAIQKCTEQIGLLTRILRTIALQQKISKPQIMGRLPDSKKGASSLKVSTLIKRQIKEANKEKMLEKDQHHFQNSTPAYQPAITNLELFIDGSGSTHGTVSQQAALTAIILREAAKKIPEIRCFGHFSGTEEAITIISPEHSELQVRETLGGILKTGQGRGSNEIDAKSMAQAISEITDCPPPPNLRIGSTHILFLTDGGTCQGIREQLQEIVKKVTSTPNHTFDLVITDGSKNSNAEKDISSIQGIPFKKTPRILHADKAEKICSEIVSAFTHQIKKNKSLAPLPPQKDNSNKKKIIKRLRELNTEPVGW